MKKYTREELRNDKNKRDAYKRYILRRIFLGVVCVIAIGLMLLSVFYGWIQTDK